MVEKSTTSSFKIVVLGEGKSMDLTLTQPVLGRRL